MLALKMGRTIAELMATMSSQEFSVWAQLYDDDQWGEARDDFRTGLLCSTIGNFAGKVLPERAKSLCPADFMPTLAQAATEKVTEPDPVMFFTAVAASKKFNK